MIAETIRRSPLADFSGRFASLARSSKGSLEIREIPFLTQLNLRADPSDASIMQAVRQEVGLDLPVLPNTVAAAGDRSALWLGPDEWLIVAPPGQAMAIEGSTRRALAASGSVVDVSANRTTIRLTGSAAHELLAFGCAIDLHMSTFGPGQCGQTMLAKAQVIIERIEAGPAFRVYVRASFATYLAEWLLDSADAL